LLPPTKGTVPTTVPLALYRTKFLESPAAIEPFAKFTGTCPPAAEAALRL
jgi:hypothetical protein